MAWKQRYDKVLSREGLDVEGIYNAPPDEEGSRMLDTVYPGDMASIVFGSKSRVGLGGMEAKV